MTPGICLPICMEDCIREMVLRMIPGICLPTCMGESLKEEHQMTQGNCLQTCMGEVINALLQNFPTSQTVLVTTNTAKEDLERTPGASSSPSMAGCTDEDKQENRENKTEKKFAVENYFLSFCII